MATSYIITFHGSGAPQYGMPQPFYFYSIEEIEAPNLGITYFVATIKSYTANAPMPVEPYFVSNAGLHSARGMAIDALKKLPQLKTLKATEGAVS